MTAIAQAQEALQAEQREPPVTTAVGAAVRPVGDEQERVGAGGLFFQDFEEYADEPNGPWDRAVAAKRFDVEYLGNGEEEAL